MKRKRFLIQPLALIYLLFMLFCDKSGLAAMSLLAAALHEMGHLVAARFMKIPISAMRFDLLGARIDVKGRILSYGQEWLLCMSGPLASLVFSLIGSLFWSHSKLAIAFSCASLLLGLLNLLPIQTFDGGRMTYCLSAVLFGERRAEQILDVFSGFSAFVLWTVALYLMLRISSGLGIYVFSVCLFLSTLKKSDLYKGQKRSEDILKIKAKF